MPPTVCKHMEKDLIVKDKNIIYIGGNQAWFLPLGYKDICEYGCGIVAVCNFLLCFFRAEYKSGSDISKDTFISFVLSIYKKYLFMPFASAKPVRPFIKILFSIQKYFL